MLRGEAQGGWLGQGNWKLRLVRRAGGSSERVGESSGSHELTVPRRCAPARSVRAPRMGTRDRQPEPYATEAKEFLRWAPYM